MVQTSRRTLVFISILLVLIFGAVIAGLRLRIARFYTVGPPIHYIIPDNFRGEFSFVQDWRGIAIEQTDGKYIITIPLEGILKVRDTKPLFGRHETTASYADGTPIPHEYTRSKPNIVALRASGGWWCVGTVNECYGGSGIPGVQVLHAPFANNRPTEKNKPKD